MVTSSESSRSMCSAKENEDCTSFLTKVIRNGIKEDSLSSIYVEFVLVSDAEQNKYKQWLPPNYIKVYPNLKIGQLFEVEYWLDNPERAIIHLDNPVSIGN